MPLVGIIDGSGLTAVGFFKGWEEHLGLEGDSSVEVPAKESNE